MIRFRLATIAAGTLLAFTGTAAAHADPGTTVTTPAAPVQVKIYLANANHNADIVTVSCGKDGPVLHTALFNDAIGANVVEAAKIYREDGGAGNAANWPVVYGPVDVPIGGHVNVDLPYVAGTSYNAVAIPKGDPWPATLADIVARLSAKPPTADNSQLFPSGYPIAPVGCPPKPPNPCEYKPVLDAAVVAPTCPPCPTGEPNDTKLTVVVPTCIPPTSEPSHTSTSSKPSSTPTSKATSVASSTPSSAVPTSSAATTSQSVVPTPTGSTTPTVPATPLAHTGASVAPYAAGAVLLLTAGGGALIYSRRARRH